MALFGFNFSVDAGQLFIILILYSRFGWASTKSWYGKAIAIPAPRVIALVGLLWAGERLYLYRGLLF